MPLVEPQDNALAGEITNMPFFPNLDMGEFEQRYRVPDNVPVELATEQMVIAINHVNRSLDKYQTEVMAAGINTLAEVPSESINDEKIIITGYKRAVYLYAKFLILEQLKSVARKDNAENVAKDMREHTEFMVVKSNEAIRRITGATRQGYALL